MALDDEDKREIMVYVRDVVRRERRRLAKVITDPSSCCGGLGGAIFSARICDTSTDDCVFEWVKSIDVLRFES